MPAKMVAAIVGLTMIGLPAGAWAQSPPGGAETIHGRILSFDGSGHLQLSDDRGFVDNVVLQPGATILPSGSRLAPGTTVTIVGFNGGSAFAANRIDVAVPPPQLVPGAELVGTIGVSLDSKNAYVGEPVVLNNAGTFDGTLTGVTITGQVIDVVHPAEGRNAQLRLHFDTVRLADGTSYPIDAVVVSMQVKTKNNAVKEAGGALAGMLIGNAIGKTVFGVSGGGIVGAVGGFLVAKDNRTDVVIPADTGITVRLVPPRNQGY
jgi:hypothetical protein